MIIVKILKPDPEYEKIPITRLNPVDFEVLLDKACDYLYPADSIDFRTHLLEHLQANSQYPFQEELISSLDYFLIHFSQSDEPQVLIEQLNAHVNFPSKHFHLYLIYLIHSIHPPKDIPGLFMHLFEQMNLNENSNQYRFFFIFKTLLQMTAPQYTAQTLWKTLNKLNLLTYTKNEYQELDILFNPKSSKQKKDVAIEHLIQKMDSLTDYQQILAFTKHTFEPKHLKTLSHIILKTPDFETAIMHLQQIPCYTQALNKEIFHQLMVHTKSPKQLFQALELLNPKEQVLYLKSFNPLPIEWLENNRDFICFLKLIPPESKEYFIKNLLYKLKIFFDKLEPLMDVLQLLPPNAQKIYLPQLKDILSQHIKNGFHYGELLERIHHSNHEALLTILPPENRIRHGFELECVLHRLAPNLRKLFVQIVMPNMPAKSIQAESLIAILDEFDDHNREDILDIFQNQISQIITQGKQLCEFLFCFEKTQRERILSKFSKQEIEERLNTIYLINFTLIALPKSAKEHFIEEHLSHLLILVKKSEHLIALLHILALPQKVLLLKHFQSQLHKLFNNELQVKLCLNELPLDAYREIIFSPGLDTKFHNFLQPIYMHLLQYHQVLDIHDVNDGKKLLQIYYKLEDFMVPKTLNQNFFGSSMNAQKAAKELLAYFKNPQMSFDKILKKYEHCFEESLFKEILEDPIMQKRMQKKETQHENSHVGQKKI